MVTLKEIPQNIDLAAPPEMLNYIDLWRYADHADQMEKFLKAALISIYFIILTDSNDYM